MLGEYILGFDPRKSHLESVIWKNWISSCQEQKRIVYLNNYGYVYSKSSQLLFQGFVIQWLNWVSARIFGTTTEFDHPVSCWALILVFWMWLLGRKLRWSSLHYLCSDLSGNKLTGPIPEVLLKMSRDRKLVSRLAYLPSSLFHVLK